MGDEITAGDKANIITRPRLKESQLTISAIDGALGNATITVGTAPGLDAKQKAELEPLVQALKADLDTLKATHASEAKRIAEALEKAVADAANPPEERKKSFLQVSAKGLTDAADLVKDIAPTILTTAGLIAKFVVGL
jgi:hypothetical protein